MHSKSRYSDNYVPGGPGVGGNFSSMGGPNDFFSESDHGYNISKSQNPTSMNADKYNKGVWDTPIKNLFG